MVRSGPKDRVSNHDRMRREKIAYLTTPDMQHGRRFGAVILSLR